MTTSSWATEELKNLRHDPEFELEELLLDINETIVERMDALAVRKVDLAKHLGVSRAFVTKLLNGNSNLTLASLVKVANALGAKVSVDLVPRHLAEGLEVDTLEFEPLEAPSNASYWHEEVNDSGQIALAA